MRLTHQPYRCSWLHANNFMAKPKVAPAPGPRPTIDDANKNLNHAVQAFTRDFLRRDGTVFRLVGEGSKTFNALVESGDADALALYMENPTEMLLAIVYALSVRIDNLERRVPR